MISIIISTRQKQSLNKLCENIKATIGLPSEIIIIENDGQKSLCQVYNDCAEKASFHFLCFIHDDVWFHSGGWGQIVMDIIQAPETGILGVMGGRYKSAFGLSWRDGETLFYRMNVKSGTSGGKHLLKNPHNEKLSQVLCLDGAFMCCRKDVWQRFPFDEKTFTGFHFYDIDFTFRVAQELKNYVTFDISLEHFSSGTFDRSYVLDAFKFEQKHAALLPQNLEQLTTKKISHLEGYALTEKLALMKKNGFTAAERVRVIKAYFKQHRNFYQLIRNIYFGCLRS